jgi:hypothetical protein
MKKIVYVIGAGASKGVGLPLGEEIKDDIKHLLTFPDSIRESQGSGWDENENPCNDDNDAIFKLIFVPQEDCLFLRQRTI